LSSVFNFFPYEDPPNSDFFRCYGLTGAGLLSLIEVLKRHPHFKEIQISLAKYDDPSKYLQFLIQNRCRKIDDTALYNFGQGLKKLKFLQKISLSAEEYSPGSSLPN